MTDVALVAIISGSSAIVGVVTGQLIEMLREKTRMGRERQFRLEDARRDLYARFVGQCLKVAVSRDKLPKEKGVDTVHLAQLEAQIRLIAAEQVCNQASEAITAVFYYIQSDGNADGVTAIYDSVFRFCRAAQSELGISIKLGPRPPS